MVAPNVRLYINHAEVSDDMEWNLAPEEILGGVGRATLTVQDRANGYEPQNHWDVKAVIANGPKAGHVLFRGEINMEPEDLPVGMSFLRWKLDCQDYNNQMDWRLVGALDGKTWLDTTGLGVFVNIDPFATSLKTDKLTVQQLFDHYLRVDGTAIETDTYVNEYLTDFLTLTWVYSKLKAALEQMAAFIIGNLQFWIDPDLFFHWVLIPAWQDLIQDMVAAGLDDSLSSTAMMLPEGTFDGLVFAPYEITDVTADLDVDAGIIGGRGLKFTFDGSQMPEQVYVRGGTGYVYNAPPIPVIDDTKTVVSVPVVGTDGSYRLYITETNTKLWHVDSTGYVSTSYDLAAIGGPWPVKYVRVAWNAARNKGGHYWKFLSGPHVGLLADNDTNFFGYGTIRVEFIPDPPTLDPAKIGTGGSGWTDEATQDPNKRQAYLDAPISVTKALRDSLGGQALYRGKFPTLRGSIEVGGTEGVPIDGWRVGQLLKITDARLPASLNGKHFIIQRVAPKLITATGLRTYVLDWGDGPQSRYSYQSSKPLGGAGMPPPADAIFLDAHDLSPGPNSSQVITGQLVNGAGEPWAIAGKVVHWTVEAYNAAGVIQPGQGTVTPSVSITDGNGKARTTLRTGSATSLVYFIFASVQAV